MTVYLRRSQIGALQPIRGRKETPIDLISSACWLGRRSRLRFDDERIAAITVSLWHKAATGIVSAMRLVELVRELRLVGR